jgi:Bacterial Ig-like domain
VWAWGSWHSGNTGGLDDCCTTYNKSPVQVDGLSGITYAVAGLRDSPYHNLAVSSDSPPPPGDSQAPSPPTITSPPNNSYDTDGSFSVSGTAEASSTVELFEGTTSKGTTKADSSSGVWSIALSGVSEGAHSYTAKATDAAGNTSSVSNSVTVKVDTTQPMVTSTTPSGTTPVARGTNLTATFSETMRASTVNTSTFKLFKVNSDGTKTQITDVVVSLSPDGITATLNPFGEKTTLLARSTKYKGVLTTGTKDLAGNPLAQQKSWTFTTKS